MSKPDKDDPTYPKPFQGATNVRSGPSTNCAVNGIADTPNKADYHCYVFAGAPGETWTFLRFKDDYYGRVRDDLLHEGGSVGGSNVEC